MKTWISRKFVQSSNMSFVVEPTHQTELVIRKSSTSYSTVSFRFAKFRSGDFTLENKSRGRPQLKVNNYEQKAIVESDTFQTTRELALKFGVSILTI